MSTGKTAKLDASATDQLRDKAAEVKHNVQEIGSIARDAAQEKVHEVRDVASQYIQQGRDKTQELTHNIEDYIRREPLKAVMIAAGVGAVIGLVCLRR